MNNYLQQNKSIAHLLCDGSHYGRVLYQLRVSSSWCDILVIDSWHWISKLYFIHRRPAIAQLVERRTVVVWIKKSLGHRFDSGSRELILLYPYYTSIIASNQFAMKTNTYTATFTGYLYNIFSHTSSTNHTSSTTFTGTQHFVTILHHLSISMSISMGNCMHTRFKAYCGVLLGPVRSATCDIGINTINSLVNVVKFAMDDWFN